MNTENRKRSYDNLSGTASGSKSGTTSGESDIPTRRAKTDAQGTGKEGVNVIEFSLSLHQPEGPIEAGSSREVGSNQDIDIFANHLAWVKKQGDYDRNASGIFQPHDGVWPGTLVDVSTGLEQEHLTNSRIEKRRQL